jgi:hypothetical protein
MCIENDGARYFTAGDFLIDSDFIMFCFSRVSAPVFLLYERRTLAPTARDFFIKLAAGEFDFLDTSGTA